MKISRGEKSLWLGQSKYGKALLFDMGMSNCRGLSVPSDPSIEFSTTDDEPADKEFPYGKVIGCLI